MLLAEPSVSLLHQPYYFPCRYAKDEQVFLCYGKYTNLELLGKIPNLLH